MLSSKPRASLVSQLFARCWQISRRRICMVNSLTRLEQSVIEQVERRFPASVDFLQSMVRQPSTLGNEKGVQEIVYRRMQEIGLAPEMWDLDIETLRQH